MKQPVPAAAYRRRYRTERARLAVWAFGLLIGVVGLLLAVAPPAALPLRVIGAAGVPLAVAYVCRGLRIGVDIENGSVIVRRAFTSQRFRAGDVVAIGTSKWFVNRVIHFDLRDGRRLSTNLIQGARVVFPDGETRDCVAVLERDLAIARGAANHSAPR